MYNVALAGVCSKTFYHKPGIEIFCPCRIHNERVADNFLNEHTTFHTYLGIIFYL